ncbi:MAG: Uma2 family endonuclease [Egibacteraceae bacterium]
MAQARATTGLVYEDLLRMFPGEDKVRRELVGGELTSSPSPTAEHQWVAMLLGRLMADWALKTGSKAFIGPLDLEFAPGENRQPDLFAYRPGRAPAAIGRPVYVVPDLVVEISSPPTRRHDLGDRRDTYARFGVPEYWFVDLKERCVLVHRLGADGRYGPPERVDRSGRIVSSVLPGFEVAVADFLPED